ncbi:MAG: ATP-binding protein [Nitrospiraceae bacterium]|nr:ATP-binding protein [Nitrospiraceae bacterium]MDA8090937.1 ATP-binding protein [Nitrospiraceae bacterium]
MKRSHKFSTDGKLRIDWFEDSLSGLFGFDRANSIGRKYYEVFPRITIGKKDAVLMAARGEAPVRLKDKCFKFSNGQFFADVVIRPRRPRPGAKVFIYPKNSCELASQLHNSQPLIDIGKIASILAHGVRNPLNAIKGAVVYLRDRYPSEQPLLEFTNLMEDEITRLDKFITSFLSTSIAEAAQEVDLNQIVKKIEVFISLQSISKDVKSRFRYGGVPLVFINPFQLEQAILNVVNNALEAMSSGGTLSVSTFFEKDGDSPDGGFAVIAISDTGAGILGMAIGNPAGGNYPAGCSLAAKAKGKGFGLFLTREIIRYYGGRLQIESRQDVGTTIRLCIPSGHGRAAGASR